MESREYFCKKRNPMKKVTFGLLVITAGALMLAFNLGAIDVSYRNVVFSWQMLLIGIGLINIFDKYSYRLGVILIFVGTFFILPTIPSIIPPFNYDTTKLFWPIFIILTGFMIMTKRHRHHHYFHKHWKGETTNEMGYVNETTNETGFINETNVFGGSNRIFAASEFKGGEIVNVFGGTKLDLTNTTLAPGRNILDIDCVFGGVSLSIPSDWVVQIEVTAIMGGFQDKRLLVKKETNDDCILVIKGSTVFGGGEIK